MKENWDGTNFIIISVYGILPAFIHKVSQLPTSGCGYSFGPAILIIDKSWNDKGLLIHELTHVKQWYRSFGRSSNKLSTDMNYRIKTEIEALSNQIKFYQKEEPDTDVEYLITYFIKCLKDNFNARNLSYDFDGVEDKLRDKVLKQDHFIFPLEIKPWLSLKNYFSSIQKLIFQNNM